MTARTLEAEVQPAPGNSMLEIFMRRLQALRALSFCDLAIAELEALDVGARTTADELLLAQYRRHAEHLVAELHLVRL